MGASTVWGGQGWWVPSFVPRVVSDMPRHRWVLGNPAQVWAGPILGRGARVVLLCWLRSWVPRVLRTLVPRSRHKNIFRALSKNIPFFERVAVDSVDSCVFGKGNSSSRWVLAYCILILTC